MLMTCALRKMNHSFIFYINVSSAAQHPISRIYLSHSLDFKPDKSEKYTSVSQADHRQSWTFATGRFPSLLQSQRASNGTWNPQSSFASDASRQFFHACENTDIPSWLTRSAPRCSYRCCSFLCNGCKWSAAPCLTSCVSSLATAESPGRFMLTVRTQASSLVYVNSAGQLEPGGGLSLWILTSVLIKGCLCFAAGETETESYFNGLNVPFLF